MFKQIILLSSLLLLSCSNSAPESAYKKECINGYLYEQYFKDGVLMAVYTKANNTLVHMKCEVAK